MLNRSQTWIEQHTLNFSPFSRKVLLALLFSLVFLAGVFTEQIYHAFDLLYKAVFTALGLAGSLERSQQEVSTQLTERNWLTMISYGLLYTILCFITVHIFLKNARNTLIAGLLYAFLFGLCIALILTGKIFSSLHWPFMLTRRLIEIIVSPLPVILLMATLTKRAK
ncbi:XrtX-associated membrane protein [Adhaeribacter soli]|uniref:Uncharacterized protein n=1 Tax=Adhaeribacter soli TaxID=2607655 RepID=A0A5N1IT17_9BACT|nr:hypothetical protein [Adhaeribacter soli]KAA9331250.1 hypothetical protein F0P94_15310 [Adhaeribacter soli]